MVGRTRGLPCASASAASLRSAAFVMLPCASHVAFGDPGTSGRGSRRGGGGGSALRRLRWLGFVLFLGDILDGKINRKRCQ